MVTKNGKRFLPDSLIPYEFQRFSRKDLKKIKNGDIEVILSKPLADSNNTKADAIAVYYRWGVLQNIISVHKANYVSLKSYFLFILRYNILFANPLPKEVQPAKHPRDIIEIDSTKVEELICRLSKRFFD